MARSDLSNQSTGNNRDNLDDHNSVASGEDSLDDHNSVASGEDSLDDHNSVDSGEDSLDDHNSVASDKELSKHFTGAHEGQGESDLNTLKTNCKKNPGHDKFIPLKNLTIKQFPPGYHANYMFDLTKVLADLTVRIAVKFTSSDRPEFVPGTKDPYPCYNTRGQNSLRTGTGRVRDVAKYTEGKDNAELNYKTCPCPECDHSDTPSKVWWLVDVLTVRHVVFDESEARQSSCRLCFDEDKSHVVNIYGWEEWGSATEDDTSLLYYVTHDVDAGNKLEGMFGRFVGLCDKIRNKCWSNRDVDKLTVIVSHPDGFSKQVSIGQWAHRQKVRDRTRYAYTNCTCPGSSGAPVCRHGLRWPYHPHSGSNSSGLNYSGVWWV